MDLLLDTHVLLWVFLNDPKLSAAARAAIFDPAYRVFVTPVNHWEVAIKMSTGKYVLHVPFAQFIQEAIHDNNFTVLPIEPAHSEVVAALPYHHRDPFDRLIIAQAIVENMTVITADAAFAPYPVRRLW
jgi:PIN domain nuclease of toxin-antitoxin system